MAEALVSVVLGQLASILRQQLETDRRLVVGVDEEVGKLTSNFQAIQAVVEDAENRQVKEKAVRDWLDKLKDTLYDIDDVLDEWNTAIQCKLQVDDQQEDGNTSKVNKKVCFLIPSYCFSPRQVFLRRDIAIKIKDLNKTLDNIAAERYMFNFSLDKADKELKRPWTTSFGDEPELFGRDEDKSTIMNLLLSESNRGPILPIISIIGMGGIGKTTLARLAFNHDEVNAHFDIKIWVCVSDPFDEIRVAKAILESMKGEAPNLAELERVLQQIHQSIKEKKFLLVLDDVWTENPKNWEQLKGSLMSGCRGSRILITTRKENVAKLLGTTNMITLGKLSNEECWSLFSNRVAFSERKNDEYEKLKEIGRKIVSKCNGLPLAVKSLGSLLRLKTKIEEWQRVLESELWELEEVDKVLFSPLLLSYYDLSSKLRKCFSYCAVFPKDFKIKKNELIQLWMAQGYLKVEGREDMEVVGEEYFENLAVRSFFQDFERSEYNGGIISCKMHDIVHDFAQFLNKNECINIQIDALAESQLEFSYKKARHAMIIFEKRDSFPISIYNEIKLRSLVVVRNNIPVVSKRIALSELFDQLTSLRTLDLHRDYCYSSDTVVEIPRGIRN